MTPERVRIAAKMNRVTGADGQTTFKASLPMGVLFEKSLDPAQLDTERTALEERYHALVARLQEIRAQMKSGSVLSYWDFGDAVARFQAQERESVLFLEALTRHLERDIPFSETMIILCRRFRQKLDRSQVDPAIPFTRYHRSGFDLDRLQARARQGAHPMTTSDIIRQRLNNQQITSTDFATPNEIVAWFGAVQAQDYPGGKWAIGLRLPNSTDRDIERAIADRAIVRTWPMRGTLHFVAAADIRWMLKLLIPRVAAGSAARLRQAGLDQAVFARSRKLLVKALEGGKRLTRGAIYKLLEAAHISTANQRGLYILHYLAEEGTICFASHEGKQPTFALLDEWVLPGRMLERDEALAELAIRYFTSHGPATLQDFAWWSGLTITDARAGLEAVKLRLIEENIDGKIYWLPQSTPSAKKHTGTAHLLPNYDEYLVAYTDRSAVRGRIKAVKLDSRTDAILDPMMVVDGQVVGRWKRTLNKDSASIATQPFVELTAAEIRAFATAANRYSKFLGMPVVLS
ncbi:MAG: winged helix DNA-binding domain-containing protein [Anaerolineae bacterium]